MSVKPVQLQRHQAGDEVTARDLNAIQDNVARALTRIQGTPIVAQQIAPGAVSITAIADHSLTDAKMVAKTLTGASIADGAISAAKVAANTLGDAQLAPKGITNASLADGTIQTLQIADNSVTMPKLSSFLRQGCKYVVAADQTLASGAAIAFATKVFDNFNQVTGVNYQPGNNGVMHISAAVRLTGGGVIPGTSARLMLMNGATQVITGQEFPVLTDQWGYDVATPQINEAVSLLAGTNYTLVFEVGQPDSAHAYPTDASATVKAAAAVTFSYQYPSGGTTSRTVNLSGSYFQATPIAQ